MFPLLQNVEVISIIFDSAKQTDYGLRRTADLPNLQHVRVKRTSHIGPVLSWLSSRVRNLRSLDIAVQEPIQPLRELLLQASSLVQLRLSFPRTPGVKFDSFIGTLDFCRLRGLRSLFVDADNADMPTLVSPLSTMNQAVLSTITLQLQTRMINVSQFIADAAPRWAALDTIFSNLAKLERVTVELKAPDGDYTIRDLLPRTCKRGITDVTLLDFDEWP